MLNSLTLDNCKIVTNRMPSEVSPKKTKPFDSPLALMISNLADSRVSIKSNSSVLVQKNPSSFYSDFDW